jgi:hypothetical protein
VSRVVGGLFYVEGDLAHEVAIRIKADAVSPNGPAHDVKRIVLYGISYSGRLRAARLFLAVETTAVRPSGIRA